MFTLIVFKGQERRLQSAQQVIRVDNFDSTIINVVTPDAKSLTIKRLLRAVEKRKKSDDQKGK